MNIEAKNRRIMQVYIVLLLYFCAENMKQVGIIAVLLALCSTMSAQTEQDDPWADQDLMPEGIKEMPSLLNLQFFRYKNPTIEDGDTMWTYLMPELPVYKEKVFRNERERRKYTRLIYNVKKVLPLAKLAKMMLEETYEVLETLPNKKAKDEHIKQVEHDIKKQYTPVMKKLTFSQGKILIKLIDRECNQEAYDIVKAFLGPMRAAFYQVFAWTFKASLKKHYDPEGEDAEIERIVRQIEAGQL